MQSFPRIVGEETCVEARVGEVLIQLRLGSIHNGDGTTKGDVVVGVGSERVVEGGEIRRRVEGGLGDLDTDGETEKSGCENVQWGCLGLMNLLRKVVFPGRRRRNESSSSPSNHEQLRLSFLQTTPQLKGRQPRLLLLRTLLQLRQRSDDTGCTDDSNNSRPGRSRFHHGLDSILDLNGVLLGWVDSAADRDCEMNENDGLGGGGD